MIKIENTQVVGWEPAIRGMRNPMNSWETSDSFFLERIGHGDAYGHDLLGNEKCITSEEIENRPDDENMIADHGVLFGPNDLGLMKKLAVGGSVHAKYRRMIAVYADITAPLYWWKEFDTYKVGTVANSCSTMHKIHAKEFTLEDFSTEHLIFDKDVPLEEYDKIAEQTAWEALNDNYCGYTDDDFVNYNSFPGESIKYTIAFLNRARELYLKTKDKKYWWQMIHLLPSSYNQKRTVMMNYEVLAGIYPMRKDHKLDEWHDFCDWIKKLPYSEVITLEGAK